jgi:hypothetical protein
MQFVFNKKLKNLCFAFMAIGIIAILMGMFTDTSEHHNRFWSNILINSFFYLAIGLGALFFYTLQYATETGWTVVVKRIFEGIFSSIPVFGGILALVLLVGTFGGHHVYHWMDSAVYDVDSDKYDAIIAGKSAYLNLPFFWIRTLVYLGVFTFFARYFRRESLREDTTGGTQIHFKLYKKAAIFLIFFAVFSSTASWDWIMSIDVHWFSTLFGWYVFSGMWVGAMITAVLFVRFLKGQGYLEFVNESHLHDLSKWMFALSFLWSYLWFSQFILIWYSNIPEEVTYFIERIEHFKVPFFGMFIVNFVFPMILLMSRKAKRITFLPIFVGLIIFLGHWMDTYMLITPGATHHFSFGFMEVGIFFGFLGLFIFLTLRAFTKAPFLPVNHPYRDESEHFEI